MLVRKNFCDLFLFVLKKFDSGKKFSPPPPARQHFLGKKKNSSKGLLKKTKNEHSKKFWKKIRAR
jgi:hypothetical protein